MGRDRSHLARSTWSVSLVDIDFELSRKKNAIPEISKVKRLFKMFSSHSVRVLRNLVSKTVLTEGKLYASREVVSAVSRNKSCLVEFLHAFEATKAT